MGRGKPPNRADANQADVVSYLERFQVTVWITSQVGGGGPDFIAAMGGHNFLFEVKQPGKDLKPNQVDFHKRWKGPIHVVTTGQQALRLMAAHVAAHNPKLAAMAEQIYKDLVLAGSEARLSALVDACLSANLHL